MVGEDDGDVELGIVVVSNDDPVLRRNGLLELMFDGWLGISGLVVCGLVGPGAVGLVLGLCCWMLYDQSEAWVPFLCAWVGNRSCGVILVDEVGYGLCVCCCVVCVVLVLVSCDVFEGEEVDCV